MTPQDETERDTTPHDPHIVSTYSWGTGHTVTWITGLPQWIWVTPAPQPEEPEAEDANEHAA